MSTCVSITSCTQWVLFLTYEFTNLITQEKVPHMAYTVIRVQCFKFSEGYMTAEWLSTKYLVSKKGCTYLYPTMGPRIIFYSWPHGEMQLGYNLFQMPCITKKLNERERHINKIDLVTNMKG